MAIKGLRVSRSSAIVPLAMLSSVDMLAFVTQDDFRPLPWLRLAGNRNRDAARINN